MSTDDPDTDTDADDLAEQFPHVAKLEQELKEADIDVDDIAQQTGATRRDVLTGSAGLLGLGALLTGGSGTASAGDDQVGSIGTDNNRLDAEIEDLDLTDQSSVPAGPGPGQVRMYFRDGTPYYLPEGGSETQLGGGAGIFEDTNADSIYEQTTGGGIETPSVSTEDVQYSGSVLYEIAIRSDGSGDATTIAEAIGEVPAIGIDNGKLVSVRFDLEPGATYTISNPQIGLPWCGGIQFLGDGSNPPTIEVEDGGIGMEVVNSELRLDDVNFGTASGQAGHYILARHGSRININNVQASGDVDVAVAALYSSAINVDSASTISGANTASSQGINIHSSSHLRLDGQVDNFDRGISLDRNGTGDIIGATIDSCGTGINAEDGSNGKIANNCAVTNHETGFRVISDGTLKLDGTADLTGNTTNYNVNDVSKLQDNSGTWQTGPNT